MTVEQPHHAGRVADAVLGDALLRAMFSQSPASLDVFDTDLRLVRVNAASQLMGRFPLEQMLGRTAADILRAYEVTEPDQVMRTLESVLATGLPVFDYRFRARNRREPASELVASAAVFRLQDADGSVLGLAALITDITARARAEAGLRLLNDATSKIGTTLDISRTAQELCETTVPLFADTVAVDVIDPVLRGHAPNHDALLEAPALRRVGFRSTAGEELQGVPVVGQIDTYPPGTPFRRALATLAPQLLRKIGPDTGWLHADRRRDARILSAGVHSMVIIPIRARGIVLGLVSFYRWSNPVPFDHKDLQLAEQLTAHAAVCLDNARLYGREYSAARVALAGRGHPDAQVPLALDLAYTYLPTGFGAGWFDVIALSGARVALTAGEMVHSEAGDPTAMGELRATVQALSDLDLPPGEILERLHDLASRPATDAKQHRELAATCLYLVYDPVNRTCTAAAAGRPANVSAYNSNLIQALDVTPGPPLGRGRPDYPVTEHLLPESTILVLHNRAHAEDADAVARDTAERIRAHLAAPGASSLQVTCDATAKALTTTPPLLDTYLVLARTRTLGADRTNSWTLANTPQIVSAARRQVRAQLNDWHLDASLADDAVLVISELVTNAVRYAEGPILVRLILTTSLLVEVTDDSSTTPHLRRALDADENGRGLFITAQVTERWGVRPGPRGKTIWAQLALPPLTE